MAEAAGKRRMTLRSGRAVLGDLSNRVEGVGGGGGGGLGKKASAAGGGAMAATASSAAAVAGKGLAARGQQQQQQQQQGGQPLGAAAAAARAKREAAAAAAAAVPQDELDELNCWEEEEEEEEVAAAAEDGQAAMEEEEFLEDSEAQEEEEDDGEDGAAPPSRVPLQPVSQAAANQRGAAAAAAAGKRKASSGSGSGGAEQGGKRARKAGPAAGGAVVSVSVDHLLPPLRELHPADRKDKGDVCQALDYVEDIHGFLKEAEVTAAARPYMSQQKEINAKMRAILIDWIVEVHMKFKLVPPTLYLAVQLIDRYCMENAVTRTKLQLVGVTALLIACKYEEIYPPEVRDCVYITDNAYTREEVLKMEQKILKHFGFRVSMPTMHGFLVRYLKIANGGRLCTPRAFYFAERALQEHEMLRWKPSLVAAAAVYLAKRNETLDAWPPAMIAYSGYTEQELLPCAALLSKWAHETTQTQSRRLLNAVKKKFASSKFEEISELDHLRLPMHPQP